MAKRTRLWTLRVTTKEMGVREISIASRKLARFYADLWTKEGHKVEWL